MSFLTLSIYKIFIKCPLYVGAYTWGMPLSPSFKKRSHLMIQLFFLDTAQASSLLGPVFPAAPWFLHTPTLFYTCLFACLAPSLRSVSNAGGFQGNKWIYFPIFNLEASRYWIFPLFNGNFSLSFDLHFFDYTWSWIFFIFYICYLWITFFFLFSCLFRTFTQFFTCMSIYFAVVIVVADLQDSLMPFSNTLWHCFQIFICLSSFIYNSVVFIFKTVGVKSWSLRYIQTCSKRM